MHVGATLLAIIGLGTFVLALKSDADTMLPDLAHLALDHHSELFICGRGRRRSLEGPSRLAGAPPHVGEMGESWAPRHTLRSANTPCHRIVLAIALDGRRVDDEWFFFFVVWLGFGHL